MLPPSEKCSNIIFSGPWSWDSMCSTTSQHRLRAEVAARGKALDAAVQTLERKNPGRPNSVIAALLLFVALPGTGPWSQGSAVGVILGFEQLFLHSCSDFNYPSFSLCHCAAHLCHQAVPRGLFCQQSLKCPTEIKENLTWVLPSHFPICSFLAEQALSRLFLHLMNITYDKSVIGTVKTYQLQGFSLNLHYNYW